MNKVYLFIAIVILIVGVVFAKTIKNSSFELQNTTKDSDITPTQNPQKETDYSDWQKYSINNHNATFEVPKDFKIEESGSYSVLASHIKNDDKVGMPRFFYVSVIPEAYEESDVEVIYNYNVQDFSTLIQTKVGEKVSLTYNKELQEWFTYERLEDKSVNGKTAKVFVNKKPWEFPEGTEEYRYIFELSDKKIIAGAYVDGPQSNGIFPYSTFEDIMRTLNIEE